MENNNPPFEVGQRIVCIKESDLLTKDHIYRVVAIRKSCDCFWDVSVGMPDDAKYCYCPKCYKPTEMTEVIKQWIADRAENSFMFEQPTSYIDIYSDGLSKGIEIAEGFAEWAEDRYMQEEKGKWYSYGVLLDETVVFFTTSQLLEKYIEQLSK